MSTYFPPGYFGPISPLPVVSTGKAKAKFTCIKRLEFRNLLSGKLGDLSNSFRSEAELNGIIDESLLTFGAIAQAWKDRVRLDINSLKQFYDITSDLSINQDLIEFSLTYQFILDRLNFILFEEISTMNPVSDITSLDEILKFCRNRVNQYQFLAGLIIYKDVFILSSPPINSIVVSDEIIDLVRIAFIDLTNSKFYKLREEDESSLSFNSSDVFITTKRVPDFYTSALGNLNEIFLYPPPANLGQLEILSIKGIACSAEINLDSIVPLPNNLVPYILYGVLADIFAKDGIGNDPNRQAYCEERWNEGITIGRNYTSVLQAYLNGIPIQLDSLVSIDNNEYGWQNLTGKPSLIGLAGYNLLAPNRIPNTNYSLLMQVITNAYLPTDDLDFIDVKPEYIESLLNYCIHLISIKDGIAAIKQTDSMKNEFIKTAVSNNIRLMKRGQSIESLYKKTKLQEEDERTKEEVAA